MVPDICSLKTISGDWRLPINLTASSGPQKNWGRQQLRFSQLRWFARKCAILGKVLSSATQVVETADGGLKPPRLVDGPTAGGESIRWARLSQLIHITKLTYNNYLITL
jgi:hypothetical protein